RATDQLVVVVDEVGEANAGQQRDGKDFLHGLFEFQEGHDQAALNVDDPYATGPLGFLQSFGDLNAAENGGFAGLPGADEGQVAALFQTPGEAVDLADRFVLAGVEINRAEPAGTRFEQPQPACMPARRMRHRQIAGDDFVRFDIDENAAALFVFTPAAA